MSTARLVAVRSISVDKQCGSLEPQKVEALLVAKVVRTQRLLLPPAVDRGRGQVRVLWPPRPLTSAAAADGPAVRQVPSRRIARQHVARYRDGRQDALVGLQRRTEPLDTALLKAHSLSQFTSHSQRPLKK